MPASLLAHRYRPLRLLGEGAMGLVWLVEDTATSREVALKVISRKVGATDKSVLQFKQEFRLMTQLRHPNCCEVYDYGVLEGGEPFFTMEVVPGHGLDELAPLSRADFASVMAQLALALGYVHQLGYVHRDLKAANVRVAPDGKVKLMDYGLMEHAGRPGDAIAGTLGYLAPEAIKRSPLDQRADLYALGCLGYEMLAGRLPFTAERAVDLLHMHLQDMPRRPGLLREGVAPEHERLVMALLAKEPADRPPSAREVLDLLGVEPPPGIGGNLLGAPLLGRGRETGLVAEAIATAAEGQASPWLLLYGPEGSGKTRLADEARCRAQLASMPCGHGSYAERGVVPYAGFLEALRELLPAMRAEVPEALAEAAPVLAKLMPELEVALAPDMDAPAKEKSRLQGAIADLLAALARVRPTVLILEDWQWVDALGAELIAAIRRAAADLPLVVILTSRGAEADDRDWVRATTQVPLAPLDAADVKRMLVTMLGGAEVRPGFVDEVVTLTDGNPLFIENLMEHLVKSRVVSRSEGTWDTSAAIATDRVPRNLAGLLREKLADLSEGALTMARIGALLGLTFDLELLQEIANYEEDELFEALDVLQRRQVFESAGQGRYRFTHDQFQARLYEELAADERIFIHGLVADVLSRRLAALPRDGVPVELLAAYATHAIGAGDTRAVVPATLAAGRRHYELSSFAEAGRFLEIGLAAGADDGGFERERLGFLELLGDLKRVAGQMDPARGYYEEAEALAREQEDEEVLARVLTSHAKAVLIKNDLPRARELCEAAMAVAEETGLAHELDRARLTGSRVAVFMGKLPEALALATAALEGARTRGAAFQLGEATAAVGLVQVRMGGEHVPLGEAALREAVALLAEADARVDLANALIALGDTQMSLGALDAARETFDRSRRLNEELGDPTEAAYGTLNLAIVEYEAGRPLAAAARAHEAHGMGVKLAVSIVAAMALAVEAAARAQLGELGEAIAASDAALLMAREQGNTYLEGLVVPYHMEVLLAAGRPALALSEGMALARLIEETSNQEPAGAMEAAMALAYGQLGRHAEGEEAAKRALAIARENGARTLEVRALKARAWIALAAERPKDALAPAEEALSCAEALGLELPKAEALGLLGEAALATRSPGARERFEAMSVIATRANAPLQTALAAFGHAAADPGVAPHAATTRAALEALVSTLDDAIQADFRARREVSRVLSGDFTTFARPVEAAPRRALGMEGGMRNMF